jgi:aminoglycoside 3-N-acetyltransferase
MLAGVRYRRQKYLTVMLEGRPTRLEYREVDHCCENFNRLDGWLNPAEQRIGVVGRAEARLVRARHVVETAVEHLRNDETAFLHPLGVDEECDEARASLLRSS